MARPADRMPERDLDDRSDYRRSDVATTTDGNGAAIAALVTGLLAVTFALLFFTIPAAFVFGIVAIIFGAVGLGKANRLGGLHKGLAITGLVSGVLALIIAALATWASVAILDQLEQEMQTNPELQQQLEELQQQVESST
jgi:hypothetical protein